MERTGRVCLCQVLLISPAFPGGDILFQMVTDCKQPLSKHPITPFKAFHVSALTGPADLVIYRHLCSLNQHCVWVSWSHSHAHLSLQPGLIHGNTWWKAAFPELCPRCNPAATRRIWLAAHCLSTSKDVRSQLKIKHFGITGTFRLYNCYPRVCTRTAAPTYSQMCLQDLIRVFFPASHLPSLLPNLCLQLSQVRLYARKHLCNI